MRETSVVHGGTEAALERARRTLLMLTRCNEAILRADTEERLFADVCRVIVETGGYRMCWVGVAVDDERRTVRPVAHAGHEDGYLATVDVVWADEPRGWGPSGTAAREGRVVVGRDFATEPSLAPWRDEALRRGYASSTGLPIAYGGERVGVLTMYAGDARAFGDEELELLRRLAEDIGYGVVSLRRRREKERAEAALVENQQSLRALFDLSPDATVVSRAQDGIVLDVNDSFLSMTGWSRGEALGRSSVDLGLWADPAVRDRIITLVEREGVVRNFQSRLRTRSGASLEVLVSARVLAYGGELALVTLVRDVTEVNRNARRYQLLAENAQDVIWTLDLETLRFSYVSPAIRRLRGLTVEQALAEPLEESMTPESLARVTGMLAGPARSGEDGNAHTGVFDQPCADGSIKHVEITTSYVRNEAGRPIEVLGVSRDATARVEAERALERREHELRTILRTTMDGFASVDAGGRFTEANESFCAITGYGRDELLGAHVAMLEEARDEGQVAARMDAIRARGSGRFETRYRRKDGRLIDVELSVRASGRADGSDAGSADVRFHAFLRDVTSLHRADAALRENEARFRTLIERSSDPIVLLDAAGQVTFWSPSAAHSLGWSPEEAIGHPFADQVRADDQPAFAEALARLLEHPATTERIAVRAQRKGAGWRTLDGLCRNLLDDPAVGALVMNLRDVTEHQQLEEQYRQAQRLESIGRLAGGVAHDFNNLLTVILSCSEAMKQDRAAGKEVDEEDIAEVHAAGERARDLTRQLLAFARKQVIAPVPLDLNEVVRGSEKLLVRVLGEDVRLVVRLAPDLWPALCDASQVEQVLVNLAVNARDAMPGGGALEIETRNVTVDGADVAHDPEARSGEWVRIVVRDTGSGMSPEVMSHLFEPFFTTKGQGRGTGLGLATVHGIVAQSGGHVHVESEEGRGTTFRICLPRSRREREARPPARPASTVRGHETVLVVEDDARVRAVTVRALTENGYHVLPAGSGEEALALARSSGVPMDLVVTDVVMPGMSGREVVDELRRGVPGLLALFVSGYTQDAIAQRGVLDSGVEFLPKPFTPATLVARVRATLDGVASAG